MPDPHAQVSGPGDSGGPGVPGGDLVAVGSPPPGAEIHRPRSLVVLRHGKTDDNLRGIFQGHRDSELMSTGWSQARAVAPMVAAVEPVAIVSSDLRRAADTADVVAAVVGLPVRRDARLREIDVGEWTGRSRAHVRQTDARTLDALAAGLDVRRGGTGETLAEVALRARAAADEVVAGLGSGMTAVLVCHGITSRALVASLVGMDQADATRFLRGLDNCRWARVTEVLGARSDDGLGAWRIDEWNAGPPTPCSTS